MAKNKRRPKKPRSIGGFKSESGPKNSISIKSSVKYKKPATAIVQHKEGNVASDVSKAVPEKKSKLKTVSLNTMLMHKILDYLDTSDLMNFARTNRSVKSCVDSYILNNEKKFADDFRITSPNDEFFRQFGHVAKQLFVDCSAVPLRKWTEKNLHILSVIAKKCDKNLECLVLKNVHENLTTLSKADTQCVRRLFSNLKKISIVESHLTGWSELTRTANFKIEGLSLVFLRLDSWKDYIRKYPSLKLVFLCGIFPPGLFVSNETVQKIRVYKESISEKHLKVISSMKNLKSISIDVSAPRTTYAPISTDFSPLAKIGNLDYVDMTTSDVNPLILSSYVSTLVSLQHHEKLSKLHFFVFYAGPTSDIDSRQFETNAFPNLKQIGLFSNFLFMDILPRLPRLKNVFIMETLQKRICDYEIFRDIILEVPMLERLHFDLCNDITEASLASLLKVCKDRTAQSKLLVLVLNCDNNIFKATIINNTVIVYPVHGRDVSNVSQVFKKNSSAFERGKLLAMEGETFRIDYSDFTKGYSLCIRRS
ncbi:hypothetical protein Bhyg_14634 [Pseudolycoriella hygida]|uniref:F-box domain-containing protein n=1 Tax=Pseudolycoriella hygida TaxID=35572 RepID=A0A9Q0MQB2_9DIPT|nr:hypothetical protein Bhyg_14634 [Pseudolycoriella hygida]